MKTYKVSLSRTYIVEIDAKDEEQAKFLSEFFITSGRDGANEKERKDFVFRFNEIEMIENEAFEVEEVSA